MPIADNVEFETILDNSALVLLCAVLGAVLGWTANLLVREHGDEVAIHMTTPLH